MEKMKFHWETNDGKTGKFEVTSYSVDECIKIAEEEIGNGAELTDYYSI